MGCSTSASVSAVEEERGVVVIMHKRCAGPDCDGVKDCSPTASTAVLSEEDKPAILIVGAGFGGLGCAVSLVGSGLAAASRVVVVDPKDYFSIGGLWQFAWTGRVELENTKWPLADAAAVLEGVDLRPKTSMQALDLAARRAALSDGSFVNYDFLVLAPGVVSDPSAIPGLEEHVDVCNIGHAERAKKELVAFVTAAKAAKESGGERVVFAITIGSVPYKCPPLPFELAMLVDHELRCAGAREGARVVITCPVPFPMAGPPPNPASECFLPLLQERGIEWMPKHALTSVAASGSRSKLAFGNGAELEVDQIFAIYPQRAPDLFVSAGLTNNSGFIPVDLQTNRLVGEGERAKNVFVIGDASWSMLPVPGQPQPKAGHLAWQMGCDVAKNIAATVGGLGDPLPTLRGGACVVESGGESGVKVEMNLTQVIHKPQEAKPQLKVSHHPACVHEKVDWANGFITQIFGDDARLFSAA